MTDQQQDLLTGIGPATEFLETQSISARTPGIDHIPSELLLEIFEFYWLASWGDPRFIDVDGLPEQASALHTIFAVIHTCSFWRAVAARCHGFWSTLNFNYDEVIYDWSIEQGNPLPLRLLGGLEDSFKLTPTLLKHASRIQEIGSYDSPWFGEHGNSMLLLDAVTRTPMPALRVFATRTQFESGRLAAQPILHASESTLKILHLEDIGLPWTDMPRFTNLRVLSLSAVNFGEDRHVQMFLREIARLSPCLHMLGLGEIAVASLPFDAKIYFPALKRLWTDLAIEPTTILLGSLEVPIQCRVSLGLHVDDLFWESHIQTPLQMLRGMYNLPPNETPDFIPETIRRMFEFRTIYLSIHPRNVHFTPYEAVHDPPLTNYLDAHTYGIYDFADKQPSFDISLDPVDSSGDPTAWAVKASRLLPVIAHAGVEVLSIEYFFYLAGFFDGQALTSSFARFTSLRYIRISKSQGFGDVENETVSAVVAALTPGRGAMQTLPAPQLNTLEFTLGLVCTDGNDRGWDEIWAIGHELKRMMNRRREMGIPLEHLLVRDDDDIQLDLARHDA